MLHWRLLSNLTRVLLVLTLSGLVLELVLLIAKVPATLLLGAVLLVAVAAIWLRRRDLNRAIAIELQREDDARRQSGSLDD